MIEVSAFRIFGSDHIAAEYIFNNDISDGNWQVCFYGIDYFHAVKHMLLGDGLVCLDSYDSAVRAAHGAGNGSLGIAALVLCVF